jgi:hypothetical protein
LKIWFKNRRLFQPNPEADPFGSKIAGYFNQIQGQARLVQKSPVISTKSRARPVWFKNRRLFQPNPGPGPFGSKIACYFNQIQGLRDFCCGFPQVYVKEVMVILPDLLLCRDSDSMSSPF